MIFPGKWVLQSKHSLTSSQFRPTKTSSATFITNHLLLVSLPSRPKRYTLYLCPFTTTTTTVNQRSTEPSKFDLDLSWKDEIPSPFPQQQGAALDLDAHLHLPWAPKSRLLRSADQETYQMHHALSRPTTSRTFLRSRRRPLCHSGHRDGLVRSHEPLHQRTRSRAQDLFRSDSRVGYTKVRCPSYSTRTSVRFVFPKQ